MRSAFGVKPVAPKGDPIVRIVILIVLLSLSADAQSTWFVAQGATGAGGAGDPMGSIQAAIAASSSGDTILVANGLYSEDIDFLGKAIRVESADGPEVTTISGTQTVVTISSGEAPGTALVGFTIRDGMGASGAAGGIHLDGSAQARVERCIIRNNRGGDHSEVPDAEGSRFSTPSSSSTVVWSARTVGVTPPRHSSLGRGARGASSPSARPSSFTA